MDDQVIKRRREIDLLSQELAELTAKLALHARNLAAKMRRQEASKPRHWLKPKVFKRGHKGQ